MNLKSVLTKSLSKITPSALINFDYPDPSRVLGLSVSHWSGIVDWKVAAENGIKFCYIKAMNGINTNIKFWKENYEGAKAVGIKVGQYSWLYPPSVVSTGGQGRAFAEFCLKYSSDLPPCIDFEWTSPTNPNSGDLYGFVVPFEQLYGSKPAIYTAPGYWSQYGSKNSMWASYPLWQAQYNDGEYDVISPWSGYKFLQWTEKGKGTDYGVPVSGERACELNYYNGTMEQFEVEFGKTIITIPEIPVTYPTGDNMIVKGTAVSALNIKPTAGGGAIATLPVGGYVFGELGTTDVIGFTHFYRPAGQLVELNKTCKVTRSGLTIDQNAVEPGTTPPDPDPTPVDNPVVSGVLTLTHQDGTTETVNMVVV